MKKPVVDYTKFRFSRINDPEYRHLWLLMGWVWYLAMYFITERFIPQTSCHVVHSFMDDIIPFNEYFILIYFSWYFLLVGTMLYFLLYDVEDRVIEDPDIQGELVFEGLGVCMGYAECRADLAKGDENHGVLKTGDVA